MSTLQEKAKLKKSNENKSSIPSVKSIGDSDWGAFGFNLFKYLIFFTIFVSMGLGGIFSSLYLTNNDNFLPTDFNKKPYNPPKGADISETFPYLPRKGTVPMNIFEAITQMYAWSIIGAKTILKTILKMNSSFIENSSKIFGRKLSFIMIPIVFIFISIIFGIGLPFYYMFQWFFIEMELFTAFGMFLILLFGWFIIIPFMHIIGLVLPIGVLLWSFYKFVSLPSNVRPVREVLKGNTRLLVMMFILCFALAAYNTLYNTIFYVLLIIGLLPLILNVGWNILSFIMVIFSGSSNKGQMNKPKYSNNVDATRAVSNAIFNT